MKTTSIWLLTLLCVTALLTGCDGGKPPAPVNMDPAEPMGEVVPPHAHLEPEESAEAPDPGTSNETGQEIEPAEQEMVREKAEVGVGARGSDLGTDVVSTPIKAYFTARERVAFEIQLPSTMQLFRAEHGRAPRSHEEFMEKIIKAGAIRLPELPQGHSYVYDPEKEELFVEHP